MEVKDMSNEQFQRYYAELLIELDNKYKLKKEYEEEWKARLRDGRLK